MSVLGTTVGTLTKTLTTIPSPTIADALQEAFGKLNNKLEDITIGYDVLIEVDEDNRNKYAKALDEMYQLHKDMEQEVYKALAKCDPLKQLPAAGPLREPVKIRDSLKPGKLSQEFTPLEF